MRLPVVIAIVDAVYARSLDRRRIREVICKDVELRYLEVKRFSLFIYDVLKVSL